MLHPLSKFERNHTKVLIQQAAKKSLSQRKLAKYLRVSDAAVTQLINGSLLPSARICVLIENKYGIKKEELRPDIFLIQ